MNNGKRRHNGRHLRSYSIIVYIDFDPAFRATFRTNTRASGHPDASVLQGKNNRPK